MKLDLNFDPFPELKTPRLVLRRPNMADAMNLYLLRSDQEVSAFLDRPQPSSIEEIEELLGQILFDINHNNTINWIITMKGDNSLIGTIGFWRIEKEHLRAEIGYMLFPEYQRRGLMQEALHAVIQFGFQKMNLHSIEANCNPLNTRSIKLLENNHFIREAYFKENFYFNGKFFDSIVYSRLNHR